MLQVLLQEHRQKVAPALKHAATRATELQHFQLKAVPPDPSAVEWRERPHDDLVPAVASAARQAERQGPGFFFAVVSADRATMSQWPYEW